MFTIFLHFLMTLQSSLMMTKEKFTILLGQHLQSLRKEKNLTQVELADLLDKEKQNINRIEKGGTNPTSWYLYQFTKALNIEPKRLFDFLP